MIHAQAVRTQIMLPPQLKDDGDFAGNQPIDTFGAAHLRVLFITGEIDEKIGSVDEASAPKLQGCDTIDGEYTDINDAVLADAIAADKDNSLFAIDLDLTKSHKRYVQVATPHAGDGVTGCNLCVIGILSRLAKSPLTASEQGLEEHIIA
jgi:hypothetical protein